MGGQEKIAVSEGIEERSREEKSWRKRIKEGQSVKWKVWPREYSGKRHDKA